MLKVGIVGKPSSGKSTFFSAATLVDVPRAAYPFTTIKPNVGVSYVSKPCVDRELNVKCKPKNGKCENGMRFIPITLVDVAGLVPDAHLGKGLGNQFLSDLMEASALIHVLDLSGMTNEKGEACEGYDPEKDIEFLEKEIDFWIEGMLEKKWKEIERKSKMGFKLYELLYKQLSGLGMKEELIREIVEEGYEGLYELARRIREKNKPIVLAGNKIDLPSAQENFKRLKKKYDIIPVCAEAELALRRANADGLIRYVPGASGFEYLKEVSGKQKKALEFIKEKILDVYGSTGVQQVLNKVVFESLGYIVVYPVEDRNHFSDKKGNVLPDAYLMERGSTAIDLAYKIHSDIGEKFIAAFDCKKKMKIGREHRLSDGDVIQILTRH
ncbi:redox-regulated ATPase YchF [Candidatus Micrarchaeota archaeon]|nr:MAG: redox-regulated ATPase YchF [Candidatus Micrarchaeota archaeon]